VYFTIVALAIFLLVLLAVSFCVRSSQWALAIWMPPAVAVGGLNALIILRWPLGNSAPGPGGGGEGVSALIVLVAWAILLALLVAVIASRPKSVAVNERSLIAGVISCILLFGSVALIVHLQVARSVVVTVLARNGTPLAGVPVVCERIQEFDLPVYLKDHRTFAVTDANGTCTLSLPGAVGAELTLSSAEEGDIKVQMGPQMGKTFYCNGGRTAIASPSLQPDRRHVQISVSWPPKAMEPVKH
jgi:hypothetical protein